jgi:Uma2 family endonuclease
MSLVSPGSSRPFLFVGLTWREFKTVEQLLNQPGYCLSFLDEVLEIRERLSAQHEIIKERLGALLECYLLMADFDFTPTGSMTLESESEKVKREADESYRLTAGKGLPDLAIEIVVSSGGINKLEAYKRLNVPEVWFWEDGVLTLYHLNGEGEGLNYAAIEQSVLLPQLNLELFRQCIVMTNHVEAVKTFQAGIV